MDDLLEQKVYQYLEPIFILLGYDIEHIAFGYENGSQSLGEYIILTITVMDEDQPSEVRYRYADNVELLIDEQIIYRGRISVTIDLWGKAGQMQARRLKTLLQGTPQVELAQKLKLGYVGYSVTRSIPMIIENKYRPRSTFDLILNYSEAEIVPIGTIGKVRVFGEDSEGGTKTTTIIEEPNYTP